MAMARQHCGRKWQPGTRFCGVCAARLRSGRVDSRAAWRIGGAIAAAGIAITTVTLGAAALGSGEAACTDDTAIDRVRRSVVRVRTDDGVGTGVIVGDGRALTAAHVVGSSRSVLIDDGRESRRGTVVSVNSALDIAVIDVLIADAPSATFGDEHDLVAGDRLLALGYALDLAGPATATSGIFSALRAEDSATLVQTDAPLSPGNSGGPLFTRCGEIVGINLGVADDAQNINFAVGASDVERLLDERR